MAADPRCAAQAMSNPNAPRQPLSVVVITLHAAGQLAVCLESARFADEIVVVDSGSADNTVEIAQAAGVRVVVRSWLGFGKQKNFALEAATHDWVLCLDADELVSPELAHAIAQALASPAHSAYAMARRNRFLGRWLNHGEGYPDWNVRLFDRRHARWSDDPVHEKVIAQGAVGKLKGDLLHESAQSLDSYLAKQNRYTTLQAEALYADGRKARVSQLWLSPVLRFVKFYVLRVGFLDGVAGLMHIAIGCFASFS